MKKEKIKRKQGGKRSKEVQSDRNQKRHRDDGYGLQRQQRTGRKKRSKSVRPGESKEDETKGNNFFQKYSIWLKTESKIVTRVLT